MITAAYYAAFVCLGLTNASLGPLLPFLADQSQVGLGQVSILFSGRWLGYLLGSLWGGRLFDRRSGHPLMAASLGIMALAMALTPVIHLIWGLLLIMASLGASEGALDVGGNTLLVWRHGRQVAPFMNGLHFFFGLGALASPLLIIQGASSYGWFAWALWFIALVTLPIALVLLYLPSPRATVDSSQSDGSDRGKKGGDPQRGNRRRVVSLLIIFFLTAIGVEQSFGGWIYAFAVKAQLATSRGAALLTSVFWGAFTFSRLLSIYVSRCLSSRTYLILSLGGSAVSLLALNTLYLLGDKALVGTILWLGTALLGVSIATVFPMTLSYAGERTPIFGQTTGLFLVGVSAGGMLIPWLIGQFFESAGPYSAMVILLMSMIGSIVVFEQVDRMTGRRRARIDSAC